MRRAPKTLGLLLLLACGTLLAAEPSPLQVGLTTHLGDRQDFVDGDRLSFLLSLDRDAHVYLFYLDADRNLLQLLPNRRMADHFFNAGLFMPVPAAKQPFRFTVSPPYGREIIYAVASDNGGLVFDGVELDNGLKLLAENFETVSRKARLGSRESFGTAKLELDTGPKN